MIISLLRLLNLLDMAVVGLVAEIILQTFTDIKFDWHLILFSVQEHLSR